MQRCILLNHDSKHWRQSLSYSAQSSPWYAATASSSVENCFSRSRAFTVGNRKKSPGGQVWTVRRMGQQLHRSTPQKIHCQIGGIERGTVMVLHLRHSSSYNLSVASLTSQSLHLRHLASRPCYFVTLPSV